MKMMYKGVRGMVAEDSGLTKPGWRDVQVMLTPLRIVVREVMQNRLS